MGLLKKIKERRIRAGLVVNAASDAADYLIGLHGTGRKPPDMLALLLAACKARGVAKPTQRELTVIASLTQAHLQGHQNAIEKIMLSGVTAGGVQ
jgi:hypothetical protein